MLTVKIDMTGLTPLLLHSDSLSDPLAEETKAFKRVSSKRAKTDADHEAMAEMEYRAGLYLGADGGVVIPARNVTKCLIDGARITKAGAKVERGLAPMAAEFPLIYDGPVTPDGLYADKRFVSRMTVSSTGRPGGPRVVRCRPIFRQWRVSASLMVDVALLSLDELGDIATNAGQMIGLGDYRKGGGFGRFRAVVSGS